MKSMNKGLTSLLLVVWWALPTHAIEHVVKTRTISDWRPFEGRVESRGVEDIIAPVSGSNLILSIAEEGQKVVPGDIVVRFATGNLEEQRQRVVSDLSIARAAYSEAKNGRHPLARSELEGIIANANSDWQRLKSEAAELDELVKLGLVSQQEVSTIEQQRDMAKRLAASKSRELELTLSTLHPAELERLQSTVSRAEHELSRLDANIEQSVIRAPQEGIIVLLPIFISGQQRTARAGDEINQGRTFMQIVDVNDIVIALSIEESRSAGVAEGKKARIHPIADRGQSVSGVVRRRGRVAKSDTTRGGRFIDVMVEIDAPLELLVPGASVETQILIEERTNVVAVPRGAITWQDGASYVTQADALRPVSLGMTDALWVEILDGVNEGDSITVP